jgi:hypothetical protein
MEEAGCAGIGRSSMTSALGKEEGESDRGMGSKRHRSKTRERMMSGLVCRCLLEWILGPNLGAARVEERKLCQQK